MSKTIPIFPLGIVAFPGEDLNLHIFEERYRQMINDCLESAVPFGLLPIINNVQEDIGTQVNITEIAKTYDDGRMDIRTKGGDVFRLESFVKKMPGKLYPCGDMTILEDQTDADFKLKVDVLKLREELYKILELDPILKIKIEDLTSYDLAHKIGLSVSQEVTLLRIRSEKKRLKMINKHLTHLIPSLYEIEEMKRKVKLNGHFKNVIPPNF